MPADAWITLAVLVAAIVALVTERFSTVIVMGSAVGLLLFTDVIDESQALSGFSSEAPATIGALYVVAGAAAATGALGGIVERVLRGRAGLLRLTSTTASLSAFVPNTPLVALLAPRVVRWSRRTGHRASRYLLPLSYASVLGGVVTLIGTSTNLVVSDLLQAQGMDGLSMFEMTPVGLPVAVAGVMLLVVVAPRLIPDRQAAGESLRETARRFHVVMTVADDGPLVGKTIAECGLRELDGVFLAAVERHERVVAVRPHFELEAGDLCFFVGDVARVIDLHDIEGLTSAENTHVLDTEEPGSQLYEAVVSENSPLVGSTLKEVGFRASYHAAVLAIHRSSGDISGKLGSIELRPGDVLLILGGPGFAANWRNHPDFSLVGSVAEPPPPRRARAWLVSVALVGMVVAAATNAVSLFEAALAAAALMVVGGAVSLGEARRSVDLNVVLTIALAVSLGTGVQSSGLAAQIADTVAAIGDPFGTVGQVAAVVAGTMLLTEMISHSGAAAIMVPVGLEIAAKADVDPRAFAIAVLVGASCSFLSPVGYQTNLMVYGLGGYRYTDFTKVGLPITLCSIAVSATMIWAVML